MKTLNLNQKQMIRMLAIVIITDPLFVKNMIIKNTQTHHLKPDNEYICDILKPIFDNINERSNYDNYLVDLIDLVKLVDNDDARMILNSTIETYMDRT